MGRSPVEGIIDQLAEELSRSVVVNDPAMQMLYASPHYGDEDPVRVRAVLHHGAEPRVRGHVLAQGVSTWTRPGIVSADRDLGMHARVCIPVRWRGELLALLMIIDADDSLTATEMARAEDVTGELAFALHDDHDAETAGTRDEALVRALVDDDPIARRAALGQVDRPEAENLSEKFADVVAVEIGPVGRPSTTQPHIEIALRHALSTCSRQNDRATVFAVTGRTAVLLVGAAGPGATSLTEQMHRVLERTHEFASGRFRCVAGIGAPAPALDDVPRSLGQARLARRAAELGLREAVATWDGLGAYGPVLAMRPDLLTRDALPAPLHRLLAVDSDGTLAATLRAYLDAAGNGPDAASQLHVHRTTLYYRLSRIRELTGIDAADGPTRLACHLGFSMLDVLRAQHAE